MTRKYPQADVKILYGKAAARCAFPNCRKIVVLECTANDPISQIGKIAHIVAHSEGGPRSDSSYPKAKLDTYENWVLLCPTCHDTIDAQENQYTVEFLQDLKAKHEEWVLNTLNDAMSEVTFAELEIAVMGIAIQEPCIPPGGFSVITPDEKIRKNQLSDDSRSMIAMGLMQGGEVKTYLEGVEQLDPGFIDRLIVGFQKKYTSLAGNLELTSDAIFEELLSFAASNKSSFRTRAAGLALLAHLFETCEVFEK